MQAKITSLLKVCSQLHQLIFTYVLSSAATGNSASWNKGDKGFVAINRNGDLSEYFDTGLPSGDYCNVMQVRNLMCFD